MNLFCVFFYCRTWLKRKIDVLCVNYSLTLIYLTHQRSSSTTARQNTRFVVNNGNWLRKLNLSWAPNILIVPTPVRSPRVTPSFNISWIKFRYFSSSCSCPLAVWSCFTTDGSVVLQLRPFFNIIVLISDEKFDFPFNVSVSTGCIIVCSMFHERYEADSKIGKKIRQWKENICYCVINQVLFQGWNF